jgi:bifunctional non-homologous end joining protein LigD
MTSTSDRLITHPDKVMFPEDGITKGEMAAYYEAIAPLMLPHLRARPITMERFPNGIGEKGFLQKNVEKGFPNWLERVDAPKKDGVVHYVIAKDVRSLLWVVNQNTITLHVWTARAPELFYPDICVFDLDPSDDHTASAERGRSGPPALRHTALALRDLLDELGLSAWIKTSGSKGYHIVVPLDGKSDSGVVSHFAHNVGALLVTRDPEHLTQEFSKADRGGRILIDTGRNGYGATFAAAYAVRPKPGAPISAPCTWDELSSGEVGPRTFTLRTMQARVEAVGDVWVDMRMKKRSLKQPMERLQALVSAAGRQLQPTPPRRPPGRKKRSADSHEL